MIKERRQRKATVMRSEKQGSWWEKNEDGWERKGEERGFRGRRGIDKRHTIHIYSGGFCNETVASLGTQHLPEQEKPSRRHEERARGWRGI